MATINKVPLMAVATLHGGPPLSRVYPEAASQTFKKGEAVYLDGDGNVAEYTAAIDDGTQRLLGFAASDGSNDSVAGNASVEVWLGFGNIFEANVTSNGAAQTTAITQVGTLYPLYQDTTNSRVAVDIADTADQGDWCRVLELSDRDAVGDTYGRVRFTLIPAALQVSGT